MSWTEQRTNLAIRLWEAGATGSQIARQLGGVTRNAVISKLSRLGYIRQPPAPVKGQAEGEKKQRAQLQAATAVKAPRLVAPPPPPPPFGAADAVMALQPHACKWPLGDPRSPAFSFCCRPVESGPYCAEHLSVAFRPVDAEEKKRRRDLQRLVRRVA